MSVSPFDSALYRDLLGDREIAALFTDSAEVRAMLLVEGALARAQGALGLIPEVSAQAIHRAAMEVQIDPGALAESTGANAVPVPGLVAAFRAEMSAPEHGQWVHFGATSQDIADTALALRLRQVLALVETRLDNLISRLGQMAETHADLPMAARTWGQVATVSSFGAAVAGWGAPLLSLREGLAAVRAGVEQVSLSGAAGTLSAMGPEGPKVRAGLAEGLGLGDPGRSWHSDRTGLATLAGWAVGVTGVLAKMGEDVILLTQSGAGEVRLSGAGGSSTMPQKQNPVLPSLLSALHRFAVPLAGVMQGAVVHRQARDGAAWMSEWLTLPQLCLCLGRALTAGAELAESLTPDPAAMARALDDGRGLIFAEALSFSLARSMPRPEAQAAVKALCKEVTETGTPLPDLARRDHPDHDFSQVFQAAAQMGTAPEEARAFARAAEKRG